MFRPAILLALACLLPIGTSLAADGEVGKAPALPFYDWKACPFEGCKYGRWTAQKETAVYDTWRDRRKRIATLATGEVVEGITGVVITFEPGVIRMDRDVPEQKLKRGELLLTYAYRGEGYSAVWFQGRYYPDFDISFAKWPDGQGCGNGHCAATYLNLGRKVWRAQVRRGSGVRGWVDMAGATFNGVDALARLSGGSEAGVPIVAVLGPVVFGAVVGEGNLSDTF